MRAIWFVAPTPSRCSRRLEQRRTSGLGRTCNPPINLWKGRKSHERPPAYDPGHAVPQRALESPDTPKHDIGIGRHIATRELSISRYPISSDLPHFSLNVSQAGGRPASDLGFIRRSPRMLAVTCPRGGKCEMDAADRKVSDSLKGALCVQCRKGPLHLLL